LQDSRLNVGVKLGATPSLGGADLPGFETQGATEIGTKNVLIPFVGATPIGG
jgi:hypothetical protein